MTPKEKAIVLCKRYYRDSDLLAEDLSWMQAKECALISAEEVIGTLNYDIRELDVRRNVILDIIDYWRKVKQEIKKPNTHDTTKRKLSTGTLPHLADLTGWRLLPEFVQRN